MEYSLIGVMLTSSLPLPAVKFISLDGGSSQSPLWYGVPDCCQGTCTRVGTQDVAPF